MQDPSAPGPSAPRATPPKAPARPQRDTVDAFIGQQPTNIRYLMDQCREYLHNTAPGLRERIKWGVPTFMMEHNLFYLNPHKDHVVLGFCNGAKMPEFRGVFDRVLAEVAHVVVSEPTALTRKGLRAAIRSEAGFPDEAQPTLREPTQAAGARAGTIRSLPPK